MTEFVAAVAAYSGHMGVRSSFPAVSTALAVGYDYESVPQVWFRGKSWEKYINFLKLRRKFQISLELSQEFLPGSGQYWLNLFALPTAALRFSLFWYVNAPLTGIY